MVQRHQRCAALKVSTGVKESPEARGLEKNKANCQKTLRFLDVKKPSSAVHFLWPSGFAGCLVGWVFAHTLAAGPTGALQKGRGGTSNTP